MRPPRVPAEVTRGAGARRRANPIEGAVRIIGPIVTGAAVDLKNPVPRAADPLEDSDLVLECAGLGLLLLPVLASLPLEEARTDSPAVSLRGFDRSAPHSAGGLPSGRKRRAVPHSGEAEVPAAIIGLSPAPVRVGLRVQCAEDAALTTIAGLPPVVVPKDAVPRLTASAMTIMVTMTTTADGKAMTMIVTTMMGPGGLRVDSGRDSAGDLVVLLPARRSAAARLRVLATDP